MDNHSEPIIPSSDELRNLAVSVLSYMADAVSIQDRDFRVIYQNQAHTTLNGDHRGDHCYRAYARRETVCVDCPVERCFSDGGSHTLERHVVRDRQEFHVEISASPLRDSSGGIIAGIEVVRNIAVRWRTEQALREERNFAGTVLNTIDALVVVLDREGRIVRFNRACEQLTGYRFDEVRGRFVWDLFIVPEEIEGVRDIFRNLKAGMFPNRHVNSWRIRDGSRRLISWSNTALTNNDGSVEYVIPTGIDITEQRHAEDTLAAETERLAVTLRSIGDGVITTGTNGKIMLLNKVAEDLTGWSQDAAAGRPLEEVFHIINERTRARVQAPVDRVIGTGEIVELANHTILIGRDGREHVISDSAAPIRDGQGAIIGAVLVFRDMTEKLILEREALKTQKMESLGILAGGIAHDYNNLLTAILGNISLANMLLAQGETEPARLRLADAERASVRAKDLTRQLLTFSKGGAPVKKSIAIGGLVRETVSFSLRGASVTSDIAIPSDLWLIEADEGQISQVLNNLVINAAQAIPAGGGTVTVRCSNVTVPPGKEQILKEGKYVRVSVRDSGCGIPREHLNKIFDPYFTTKEKGIGLGLATSYSIVKQHAGLITVESEPEKGTEFHVYLPAYHGKAVPDVSLKVGGAGGTGRVLVMDDEEIVRTATAEMLQTLGYAVETSPDGVDAVQRYAAARERGIPFDLVIMDATVPGGMGGRDAVKVLLKTDPGARVVLTSGYAGDELLVRHRDHGFKDVIQKPYTVEELGALVRKVIAAGDPGAAGQT
ncbi:MAG: hybrid sensor histidine kinase/response regulator [Nitrospirota bacterium]